MINSGSYTDRLWLASYALHTIKNQPEIALWFDSLGFDAAAVSDGLQTYVAAAEALSTSMIMLHERMGAVDHKRAVFRDVRQRHGVVVQMARLVIPDTESRLRLGLKGRQPEAVDTWHGYAACFYQSLLPEDLERLHRVGITAQRIQLMGDLLDASVAATARAKVAAAAAVEATVALKAAFKALAAVMAEISVMARVGEAGKTNLAACLRLKDRYLPDLPAYPGAVDDGTDDAPAGTSIWDWFDISPQTTPEPLGGTGWKGKLPLVDMQGLILDDPIPPSEPILEQPLTFGATDHTQIHR